MYVIGVTIATLSDSVVTDISVVVLVSRGCHDSVVTSRVFTTVVYPVSVDEVVVSCFVDSETDCTVDESMDDTTVSCSVLTT